ncbi:MAG: TonB family protein [Saprospiraceae bacterium]|nr:TonB family protein [Saprospiraceae bacterium]
MKKIHELQADAVVLQSTDVKQYSSLLIHNTLESNGLGLASSFQDGFIIARLKAMKQGTRNLRSWKLASLIGLCGLLIVFLSCGQELDSEVEIIEQQKDRLTIDTGSEEEVLTVVEELPAFKGGMNAFYHYLRMEMRYPLEARKSSVEGRVDVQFIVEKDGSLSNVKVLEGIGAGCDEEAVRVIQKSPPFNPGKQRGRPVRVRMVIPIIFELDPVRKNRDNSSQGIIIIEKAAVKASKPEVVANYENGEWFGTIKDEHGEPLAGANIVIEGSSQGTTSTLDGTFNLAAPRSKDIIISFVGYETIKVEGE